MFTARPEEFLALDPLSLPELLAACPWLWTRLSCSLHIWHQNTEQGTDKRRRSDNKMETESA